MKRQTLVPRTLSSVEMNTSVIAIVVASYLVTLVGTAGIAVQKSRAACMLDVALLELVGPYYTLDDLCVAGSNKVTVVVRCASGSRFASQASLNPCVQQPLVTLQYDSGGAAATDITLLLWLNLGHDVLDSARLTFSLVGDDIFSARYALGDLKQTRFHLAVARRCFGDEGSNHVSKDQNGDSSPWLSEHVIKETSPGAGHLTARHRRDTAATLSPLNSRSQLSLALDVSPAILKRDISQGTESVFVGDSFARDTNFPVVNDSLEESYFSEFYGKKTKEVVPGEMLPAPPAQDGEAAMASDSVPSNGPDSYQISEAANDIGSANTTVIDTSVSSTSPAASVSTNPPPEASKPTDRFYPSGLASVSDTAPDVFSSVSVFEENAVNGEAFKNVLAGRSLDVSLPGTQSGGTPPEAQGIAENTSGDGTTIPSRPVPGNGQETTESTTGSTLMSSFDTFAVASDTSTVLSIFEAVDTTVSPLEFVPGRDGVLAGSTSSSVGNTDIQTDSDSQTVGTGSTLGVTSPQRMPDDKTLASTGVTSGVIPDSSTNVFQTVISVSASDASAAMEIAESASSDHPATSTSVVRSSWRALVTDSSLRNTEPSIQTLRTLGTDSTQQSSSIGIPGTLPLLPAESSQPSKSLPAHDMSHSLPADSSQQPTSQNTSPLLQNAASTSSQPQTSSTSAESTVPDHRPTSPTLPQHAILQSTPPSDQPVPQSSSTLPSTQPVPQSSSTLPSTQPVPQSSSTLPSTQPVPQSSSTLPSNQPVPQSSSISPSDQPVPRSSSTPPSNQPVPQSSSISPSDQPVPQSSSTPPSNQPVPQSSSISPSDQPVPQSSSIPPSTQPVPQSSSTLPSTQPVPQSSSIPPSTQPVPQSSSTLPSTQPVPQSSSIPPSTQPVPQSSSTLPSTQPVPRSSSTPPSTQPVPQSSSTPPSDQPAAHTSTPVFEPTPGPENPASTLLSDVATNFTFETGSSSNSSSWEGSINSADSRDDTFWPIVAALVIGIPSVIVFGIAIAVIYKRRLASPARLRAASMYPSLKIDQRRSLNFSRSQRPSIDV